MISRIEGQLVRVQSGRAEVRTGAMTYELLIPSADEQRLGQMVDQDVEFLTLHYLEGQGQGSAYTPRLIGFAREEDRAFFELFTTVKGMGNRKALRALALPFGTVAEAIASKDIDTLKSLPEIGKRTAETIVAELNGKVDRFIEMKPGLNEIDTASAAQSAIIQDAVTVLTQLGEPTMQAHELVRRVMAADPTIEEADELVAAAFRLKELG